MKIRFLPFPVFFIMSALCFAQITQQTHNPLKTCPKSPNCVSSHSQDSEHAIPPIVYSGLRSGAIERIKKVLVGMKRTKIVAEKDDYLHAEAKSLIFRFVDDVEFHFPENASVIYVRSASRTGYSDLGVNRKRVEEIRKRFNEER